MEFKSIGNNKTCNIKSLDNGLQDHASVVTPNGIVTCGGWTVKGKSNTCFRLTNQNTWQPFPNMNFYRSNFHMVVLGDILVAIGGLFEEKTYEKINWKNGEKWEAAEMNVMRGSYEPCVTKWDEESVLITGGTDSGHVSNSNFESFR